MGRPSCSRVSYYGCGGEGGHSRLVNSVLRLQVWEACDVGSQGSTDVQSGEGLHSNTHPPARPEKG